MKTLYENPRHPELNVVQLDADQIEGAGLKAVDVTDGFLVKTDVGNQQIYLDNEVLKALYNMAVAKGNIK